MKKYLFIILAFLICDIYSQISTPSAYTVNYRLRQWAKGATPSADSLNQNWIDIDTYIKKAYDSAEAKVKTYSNQTINGIKTFRDSTIFSANIYQRGASIDTIASRSWVRDNVPSISNVVTLNTAQTITAGKTFTGYVGFSGTGYFVLPTAGASMNKNALTSTTDGWFKYRTNDGIYDTVATHRYIRDSVANLNSIQTFTGEKTFSGQVNFSNNVNFGNGAGVEGQFKIYHNTFSPIASYSAAIKYIGEADRTIYFPYGTQAIDSLVPYAVYNSEKNDLKVWDVQTINPSGGVFEQVITKSIIMSSPLDPSSIYGLGTTTPSNGTQVTIIQLDGTNTLELIHNYGSANYPMILAGGTDWTMGDGDAITFIFDASNERWIEISRSNK